jgi:hypothetical protein
MKWRRNQFGTAVVVFTIIVMNSVVKAGTNEGCDAIGAGRGGGVS